MKNENNNHIKTKEGSLILDSHKNLTIMIELRLGKMVSRYRQFQ